MDKWAELRETIQELCDNNSGEVHAILHYLLNLMDVLDGKAEQRQNPRRSARL